MKYKIMFTGGRKNWIQQFAEPSTTVNIAPRDPKGIKTPHLEYEFYEHIATHRNIRTAVRAEKNDYDAMVITCFYDPGLREARELVQMPIVGVCEASLHVASMIAAGKFSILVGRRKWIPKMVDNARNYGLESRIASWRVLNLTVPEMKDREKTKAAILREAKAAIDDDLAECIVLGCTGLWGQAKEVQEKIGVQVLDPVLMGLKVAEMRAMLWKKFGISQSKIGGYEAPPPEELKSIYKKVYGSYP
jgi:allantoin racemase